MNRNRRKRPAATLASRNGCSSRSRYCNGELLQQVIMDCRKKKPFM
ncbi:hypothetical protein M5E86_21990 [Blautia wexlerae]|nr:hypothetical protein M5E86_21990 [Blautia wexlerae]